MPQPSYTAVPPPPVHIAYPPQQQSPAPRPSSHSSASSVSSPTASSSVSAPTSATSAASAIDDILHSFASAARPPFHSTPPASGRSSSASSPTPLASNQPSPSQQRQRETDRLVAVVASIRNCRTASELSSLLGIACLQTQPAAFLDVARYLIAADGLSVLVVWLEQTYAAHVRDSTPASQHSPLSQPADGGAVPGPLVDTLLLALLQSLYRLAVYQRQESRARMPRRSTLLPLLHALLAHPREEVRELALRLFEHYQVLFGGADVVPQPVLPSSASGQQPLSVGNAMRLEFELFVANEQQKLLLQQHAAAAVQQQQQEQQLQQHLSAQYAQQQQSQPYQHAQHNHTPDPASTLGLPSYADRSISPSAFLSVSPLPPNERSPSPPARMSPPIPPPMSQSTAHDASAAHVESEQYSDGGGGTSDMPAFASPLHASSPVTPVPQSAAAIASPPPPSSPERLLAVNASLVCTVCEHVSASELANYQHALSAHGLLLCVACALTFPSEDALYSHFEAHANNDPDEESSHACGLCGLSYTTEEALTLHHTIHVMDRKGKERTHLVVRKRKRKAAPAAAEAVESNGGGGSPVKRARREEEEEEDGGDEEGGGGPGARFPPAVCSHPQHAQPLSFACDEDLQSHSGHAHSLYFCFAPDCGAQLHTADELAEHMRAHVTAAVVAAGVSVGGGTQLPASCAYCGAVWSKRVTKTEHMHRHDKPFRCSFCPMRFARRTRWRAHIKRKHPTEWEQHTPLLETSK